MSLDRYPPGAQRFERWWRSRKSSRGWCGHRFSLERGRAHRLDRGYGSSERGRNIHINFFFFRPSPLGHSVPVPLACWPLEATHPGLSQQVRCSHTPAHPPLCVHSYRSLVSPQISVHAVRRAVGIRLSGPHEGLNVCAGHTLLPPLVTPRWLSKAAPDIPLQHKISRQCPTYQKCIGFDLIQHTLWRRQWRWLSSFRSHTHTLLK
jgi:hypothetical protein